ncbi:hypothetical protein [Vibrio phage XM1]|nr:hypothetical protein [Vibrio phage XM1]
MEMTKPQLVAITLAMQCLDKSEDLDARNKLWSGQELDNGDCRALIVACWRNDLSTELDVKQLAEWFFDRYGFDDKVKIVNLFRVEFY